MTMPLSAPQANGDADGDGAILDAIERFVERSILPVAHDLEARDEYPHGIVEEMKDLGLFGATIAPEYRRARPVGGDLFGDHRADYGGVDVDLRHRQFAPDHGGGGPALRHRAAEGALPAEIRDRRTARRHRA